MRSARAPTGQREARARPGLNLNSYRLALAGYMKKRVDARYGLASGPGWFVAMRGADGTAPSALEAAEKTRTNLRAMSERRTKR